MSDRKKTDLLSEGTRIDLGEDLLERTAALPMPAARGSQIELPDGPIAPESISDHMQSARILMGEGILEDAKKVLRRVLLADPSRVEARKMLQEVHEIELKQIFGESDNPRHKLGRDRRRTEIEISAEAVVRGLDSDLMLGLEERDLAGLSLFGDPKALAEFGERMDRELAGLPPAERVDLGVAFLEMGLYSLAEGHFQAALGGLELQGAGPGERIAATGLVAYARILAERPYEAASALQPILNDMDIEREHKLDLIYLMGRALEGMGKVAEARQWYLQAQRIEPHYRDTRERLRAK